MDGGWPALYSGFPIDSASGPWLTCFSYSRVILGSRTYSPFFLSNGLRVWHSGMHAGLFFLAYAPRARNGEKNRAIVGGIRKSALESDGGERNGTHV